MAHISNANLAKLSTLINDELLIIDKFEQDCLPGSLAEAKEILHITGKLCNALLQMDRKIYVLRDE